MDVLNLVLNKIETGELVVSAQIQELVARIKGSWIRPAHYERTRIILLTMHRRESFGTKMVQALSAIRDFANEHPEVCFIFPVHPNPQVKQAVELANLKTCSNIFLIEPLAYHELVYILDQASCVATDSGGLCEEAASLGKPVVLLRNETDRPEAIQANLAWLVGYDKIKIIKYLLYALNLPKNSPTKLYGDGQAASKIAAILKQDLK